MKSIRHLFGNRTENWLYLGFIILGTLLIYTQVIGHKFVSYDDNIYLENPIIANGISIQSIVQSFKVVINDNWHPITILSLMLDTQVFGVDSASGFHFTNIALHIINGILVYFFILRLTGSSGTAVWASLFFVVHPLQVESVAWVAERKGLLAAMFFLSSLNLYLRSRISEGKFQYILSIMLFLLGLMAKAVIVMLPVVLVLMEWLYLNQNQDRKYKIKLLLKTTLPFFIIALGMGLLTIHVQHASGVLTNTGILPVTTRILNAILSVKIYITQAIAPMDLSAFYPYLKSYPLYLLAIYFSFFLIFTGLVIYISRSEPGYLFGWMWFLVLLLPVLGFIQTGAHSHADRYMYLPLLGLVFIAVNFAKFITSKTRLNKIQLRFFAVALLFGYGIVSWVQAEVWNDTESLFLHATKVTKGNYIAHASLAIYYLNHNESKKAWIHYTEARKINPKYPTLYSAISTILVKQKKLKAALLVTEDMLKAGVNIQNGERASAEIMVNLGRLDDAKLAFQRALALDPDDARSIYEISYTCYRLNKYDEALAYLHKLSSDFARDSKVLRLFGDIYAAKGNKDKANYYYALAKEKGEKTIKSENK